jgi:hypothetical protein
MCQGEIMEGFIVSAVRVLMHIGIFVLPVVGFFSSGKAYGWGHFDFVAALFGGLMGFISAIIIFGVIAILLQIEKNTRR